MCLVHRVDQAQPMAFYLLFFYPLSTASRLMLNARHTNPYSP